ncbi:endonuclease III [Brachybacterium sp. DNPG3]
MSIPAGLDLVDLRALHADLLQRHGPQGWWWPGEEPFEIAVGAVLVQRSRWEQASLAVETLRGAGLLAPAALAEADEETVRALVRPAGFPSSKPRRVLALARWMRDHGDLTVTAAADRPAEGDRPAASLDDAALRLSLLGVEGVGEETADAIALYCFARPVLVCDEYARRLLRERGHRVPGTYAAFRREIAPAVARAGFSVEELAELHGLIVEEGKVRAASRGRRARPSGA